jgi:lauroyl/myristoyl acyltransferase
MSSHPNPEPTAAALAEADQPVEHVALPPAELRVRLRTSPTIRRALPSSLVVARAVARAGRAWEHDAHARERALRAMEAIVGGTERAGELEPLARAHLAEAAVREQMLWQPWGAPLVDDATATHLRTAADSGRGVIVSNCHLGPFFMSSSVFSRMGRTPYIVAAPWVFDRPQPGYWGRYVARWCQGTSAGRARLVNTAGGAFATAEALLRRGELLLLAFDMPGSRETGFLGKPVMLASGTARLAAATGALALPMWPRRRGTRLHVTFAPALDPCELGGADALHDALAAVHERWILADPAALEDPRRPGAWEDGATAQAWRRAGDASPR